MAPPPVEHNRQLTSSSDSKQQDAKNLASPPERAITPLTSWVEKKIQDSELVEPSGYKRKTHDHSHKSRMRWAIEQARAQYSGTVLSAKKTEQGGAITYHVKILSADGIVKTLDIADAEKSEQGVDRENTDR